MICDLTRIRLGGRAHRLTLLEFSRRLGLYHVKELDDEGFDVCFQGGMFDARHQNGYANVAWLIARWIKRKGAGTERESLIFRGQFITMLARKVRVLSDEVLKSLSSPIYYRDLDTTTLRELIDSEAWRYSRERTYRQSYHWDMYPGVFEHMDGVYNVPLQRAYNPPGYAQPQYDQYYQQFSPQQQPNNDDK
nr:hypothetical protein [Tanacetum cinerariifolium]